MIKFFVALIMIALLAFIGYHRYGEPPLTTRGGIDAGIEQVKRSTKLEPAQEQLLRVQLAITDFTAANGHPPARLAELVPKYFDEEPRDPATGNPYPYKVENNSPRLGAQTTQVAAKTPKNPKEPASGPIDLAAVEKAGGFINPNTMPQEEFVYDKTGKRDPFEPFDLSATPSGGPGGALTAYTLGQLRLTAVVVGPTGEKKGIVEDDQGRGYTVSVGAAIGLEGGQVVAIESDRLKIVVTKKDFTGKEIQTISEMKINTAANAAVNKAKKKTGR